MNLANIFSYTARSVMLFLGILAFLFALIFGANLEKGFMDVLRNSPNVLPWVFLLLAIWLAWKRELLGGIVIVAIGVIGSFFFSIWNNLFEFVFWLIFIIIIMGFFFIISW